MKSTFIVAFAITAIVACDNAKSTADTKGDATPKVSSSMTLPSGTDISATTLRTISSRHDKAGDSFTASVATDMKDSKGRVVIPAGAILNLTITQIDDADNKSKADGKLTVSVSSVTVGGNAIPLDASITSMAHTLKGQGVGAGEVEKTAAGAAIGGIVGRVVGGNSKGTVIGAVVGGAAGAAVAVQSANRDVVVMAGTPIVVTLDAPVTIKP